MVHSGLRCINLIPMTMLSTEDHLRIREIRNEPSVRAVMYTDHEISLDEHLGWIKSLKSDDRRIVFGVVSANTPLGIVSFNAIDRLHRKADWAYYLAATERGSGLGTALEIATIEFAFGPLDLDKLNCEVIETNPAVVKFHQKFGFEIEGFRKSNIIKNGVRIGVSFLGLQRDAWFGQRQAVLDRYRAYGIAVQFQWADINKLDSNAAKVQ